MRMGGYIRLWHSVERRLYGSKNEWFIYSKGGRQKADVPREPAGKAATEKKNQRLLYISVSKDVGESADLQLDLCRQVGVAAISQIATSLAAQLLVEQVIQRQ